MKMRKMQLPPLDSTVLMVLFMYSLARNNVQS